ncbi:ABC transporter ATP-binding protein [Aliikangiella sp. G2MR2-5]|uniref:ABC transporter ATP-binding protein n=1 Tax=Aliikangiella sp. G2MR2-5 TaxID=2788943 RepID=UPI0018AAABBA|nr:ABC transporter ATP-binding protein [Aliikangiella sp. G2MR2-5]
MNTASNVIELDSVTKALGGIKILKNLNLKVPDKSVFAFLGNNGEGKSTTIRILTGLIKADSGSVYVLGKRLPEQSIEIRRQLGCIVDSPALYPQLNGEEFLRIGCYLKKLGMREIDHVLDIVDLANARFNKIEHYSLGMKQRLALAMALLGKPRLLILDEPTNGLDPSGMQEIRELICSLPQKLGCSVFVSSHLLDEVEKMATHVAVLEGGNVLQQAELSNIVNQQTGQLRLEVSNSSNAQGILKSRSIEAYIQSENQIIIKDIESQDIAQINRYIIESGIELLQSIYSKPSLEDWFLTATSKTRS